MTWTGYSEGGTGSQERGPGSFALQVPGVPGAKATGTEAVPVQAGVRGQSGPGITAPVAVPQRDGTMDLITKMGQDALAPELERIRTEAFVTGATRAAQGEALQDIVNDQPWYTQVFGPGAAAEGARAYTASARVTEWATKQQQALVELRKQSPEQVAPYFARSMQEMLTGDPAADTQIQAAMVKALPALAGQHMKEHVAWQQEVARDSRLAAWTAGADHLEALAKARPDIADRALPQAQGDLLALAAIPEGVNPKQHEKDLAAWMALQASEGKFQALQVFRKAGVIDALEPAAQAQLLSAARAGAKRALTDAVPQFAAELRALRTDTTQSTEQFFERLDGLNARVAAATGVPLEIAQFVPAGGYDNFLDSLEGMKDREQARKLREAGTAAKAAAEAVAQADMNGLLTAAVESPAAVYALTGFNKTAVRESAGRLFSALPPAQAGKLLTNLRPLGEAIPEAKTMVQAMWNTHSGPKAPFSPGWENMAQMYAAADDMTKPMYFTDDQRQVLDSYVSAVRAGVNPEQAFVTARVLPSVRRHLPPEDLKKDAQKVAVRELVDKLYTHYFSEDTPKYDRRLIESGIAARLGETTDLSDAARASSAAALFDAKGAMSSVGNRVVLNEDPEDARSRNLGTVLGNIDNGVAGREFRAELKERIAELGKSESDEHIIIRRASRDKALSYVVIFPGAGGEPDKTLLIHSDSIMKRITAAREAVDARRTQVPQTVPARPAPSTPQGMWYDRRQGDYTKP